MKLQTSHAMGVRLQEYKLTGVPYVNLANTTLNEKFNIQAGIEPTNGVTPTMVYLAIGNGGHTMASSPDGTLSYPELLEHDPADCALFNHLPFVLRTPDNDLNPTQMANYALRMQITISGQNYIAYYLRKFDMTGVTPTMLLNTVQDGVTTSVPWVPTSANLNPTPHQPSNTGSVPTNGTYISVQEVLSLSLTQSDISELMNVAQILYGDQNLAIVSEFGLVAAVSQVVSSSVSGSGTISYSEAIGAILCSSISAFYHLPSVNNSLVLDFDVGGAESLYGPNDGTGVTQTIQ